MRSTFILVITLSLAACSADRIAQLEKQNRELQARLDKQGAGATLDLQVKCAAGAKAYFNENWRADRNTLLLDYNNHYNKSLNKCFILVQYNWWWDVKAGLLAKSVVLTDVYERTEYARAGDTIRMKDSSDEGIVTCSINGQEKSVKAFQECFDQIYTDFMRN